MAGAGWAPIQGAAPCCALLASRGADELVASKGFVSMSQLLAPFATTTVNVRDPSTGMTVSTKITLDVRDLRKDGFLLSHTVLPHVLHEALLAPSPAGVWSVDGSLKQFNDALAQWAEPVDQETFRSYLSCLFFVSTRDENPLAALSQLIQLQHSQQHSSDGISLAPSHCARPAWTTPATLKHYVVVYEGSEEQRSREIFSQMCSTYGIESCSQLRLDGVRTAANGDEGFGSPDPWSSRLPSYRILEAGLERARLSLIEKAAAAAAAPTSPSTPSMGITTISSSYSISSAASASPSTVLPPTTTMTYAAAAAADGASVPHAPILDPLSPVGGPPLSPESRWMGADSRRVTTQADKDACARLIEEYARNCLVPHAERVMRTLNEAVAGRRGISRSLASGMKKWFGGGGSSGSGSGGGGGAGGEKNGTGGGGGASVSYSPEAPQMQMRRLADLAFLFGLNAFAHSQYQAVKKEFAADNAWLHHALALEMSAYSLHLAHPQLTAAQFRCDYVENALGGLLQNGARWPSLLRAGLAAARIHTHLDQHTQAAAQLVRLTTVENDNAVGVALWSAAGSFARAKMHRKAAFYRFLAAHRWSKGGQPSLQLAAAAAAFPEYVGKRWSMAEERLALELSSWSPDGRTAIDAAERLVAPRAGRADADTEAHLAHYGRVRARHAGTPVVDAAGARSCLLPAVDVGATRVICGERPLPAEVLAGRRGEEGKWRDMERAAFHAIAGTSTGFRPAHIVSDADTDNARVRETPGGERFRVQLRVRNPLPIPLQLRDVHLGVADVERRGEGASSHHHPRSRRQSQEGGGGHPEQLEEEHEGVRVHRIDSLHLQPDEARVIELWVEPAAASAAGGAAAAAAAVAAFRVASLRYQLCCAPGVMARGEIALEIRGKRLNKTEKQMKSPTYATDERLRTSVAARAWPLCDVRATRTPAPGGAVYCDQLITLNLEITNAGAEPVEGLALAVDAVDRVMVEEEEGGEDGGSSGTLSLPVSALDLAATPGVRAFALRRGATGARLDPGARRRVVVKLRAPSTPAASHAVSLLLLYRGPGGGATREWRTRVECRVAALLAASTRVLDPYHGLVALRLANALTADDAAMARAEVTRVRVAVAARHRGAVLLAPEDGLAAVRSAAPAAQEDGGERRVRLESGQSQEVCVRIAAPGADGGGGGADASGADADWTLVHGEMPPDWPLPVPEEEAERVEWGRRRLVIGVAWRANIVAKDGMVSSILGESFLPDPFAAAGLHVAGLQLGFSLSTPGGVASPIPAGDDEDGEGGEAAPVYVSVVPPAPVEHDFERSRLCEFPVTLVLRNECGRARMADVELRMKPKVREPLSPPSPPPRQQWWLTRECMRVRVPPRDTVEMRVMVRVLQPSAYDLLGAQMAATVRMEGEERTRALRVPPAMAVVYAAYGGENA